jgi:hypothetical protein
MVVGAVPADIARMGHRRGRDGPSRAMAPSADAGRRGDSHTAQPRSHLTGSNAMSPADFLQTLIAAVRPIGGRGVSQPASGAEWLTWCVVHAVQAVRPMTLMVMALYHEPRAAFVSALVAKPLSSLFC